MKFGLIYILALIAGMLLGPSSLISAKAASPPIDWASIPFVVTGSIIAVVFIIGIQIIRKDPKYSRVALKIFKSLSVVLLGSGLGALATSVYKGEYGPASFFFFAIGVGLITGVLFSEAVYRAKYKNAL